MAAKPQMTVRLAPSVLHALIYIAEREGSSPAELARSMITSASQASLDRHAWRVDCQDAYMRWLVERRKAGEDLQDAAAAVGDIAIAGEEEPAATSVPTRADAPYGASATRALPIDYSEQPPRALAPLADEAARLVAQHRPDGSKRRT